MPRAHRGAAPQVEPVDRRIERLAVDGRRRDQHRGRREGDDADLHVGGLALDELLGRDLRGDDAVGLDVLGAHRARDVHREKHRARDEASVTTAAGRATARISTVIAISSSAGGTCRRQPRPRSIACLTSARLA